MHNLLVVLQVIGSHVGFGTEVTAVRLDARVNDLMSLQPGLAAERLPADGTEPCLHLTLLLQLGHAVGVQPVQMVLQVIAAVEAQVAQVAGKRLLPRVDEGVPREARLALHHLSTNVTNSVVRFKLHSIQRCMLGV